MHLSSALRDMRVGTGQLLRVNTDSNICPSSQCSTHQHRVQFHFLHGNSKAQGCALLGENVRSHRACAWAEDPAQTPPHLNTHCQLKCLSCPVTHVPSHGPGRRSNSCSGRDQETLAGRSGGVSVTCFTINDKKLQKFRSALNQ